MKTFLRKHSNSGDHVKKTALALSIFLVVTGFSATYAATPSAKPKPMAGMDMSAPTPPPISGTAAMMGGTIFDAPMPNAIANISLKDQNGKSFTLASLRGKEIVLTDFFTSCDMICPMTTVNMRDIALAVKKAGESSKVKVLEVTVDPGRDTVSRLKAYQSLYGDSDWTLATGSAADITKFWRWFGVYTKKIPNEDGEGVDWQTGKKITYDIQHDDVVILLGANSHYRWIDLGNPAVANPTELPATLKRFLSDQGRLNLLKPQQPDWTVGAVYGALQEVFGLPIGPKMKM